MSSWNSCSVELSMKRSSITSGRHDCSKLLGIPKSSVPEIFFEKVNFDSNKSMKNYPVCKEWNVLFMTVTGLDKQKLSLWICKYFFIYNFKHMFLVLKRFRLIETVLLSTHNICFGWKIRKLFFCYTLLTKVLDGSTFIFSARHWSTCAC